MLGYRLVRRESIIYPRSRCPACKQQLVWYDLVPVLSWLILQGRCRACTHTISILYPLIELITIGSLTLLWYRVPSLYFPAYFVFFSALIVTIRSDLETMLISRYVTLFILPVFVIACLFGLLPISPIESMVGAATGFLLLRFISWLYIRVRSQQGIGEGDAELLALIGAVTGPQGVWATLLIGSVSGTIIALIYLVASRQHLTTRLPFGPFLAGAAMLFSLYAPSITDFLFHF